LNDAHVNDALKMIRNNRTVAFMLSIYNKCTDYIIPFLRQPNVKIIEHPYIHYESDEEGFIPVTDTRSTYKVLVKEFWNTSKIDIGQFEDDSVYLIRNQKALREYNKKQLGKRSYNKYNDDCGDEIVEYQTKKSM